MATLDSTFVAGDKVRVKPTYATSSGGDKWSLTPGVIYTVKTIDDNGIALVETGQHGYSDFRFERVDAVSRLEELVAAANVGRKAILELMEIVGYANVEWSLDGKEWKPFQGGGSPYQYRLREKSFPLKLIGNYEISMADLGKHSLKIGCKTFLIAKLIEGLLRLGNNEPSYSWSVGAVGYTLNATRRGIQCGDGEITWAQAETLSNALQDWVK
jgi:hypothetical protein